MTWKGSQTLLSTLATKPAGARFELMTEEKALDEALHLGRRLNTQRNEYPETLQCLTNGLQSFEKYMGRTTTQTEARYQLHQAAERTLIILLK